MITIKKLFIALACIGVIVISALGFIIPNNHYEIVPAMTMMSFDKPLWFCYMFGGSSIYLIILYCIYEKLEERKTP